jgi:hypothetical protein
MDGCAERDGESRGHITTASDFCAVFRFDLPLPAAGGIFAAAMIDETPSFTSHDPDAMALPKTMERLEHMEELDIEGVHQPGHTRFLFW